MTKIELKNGSVIECLESTSSHRGKNSHLVSFYCINCKTIHYSVPVSEMKIRDDNFAICKTSFNNAIKPYLADQK